VVVGWRCRRHLQWIYNCVLWKHLSVSVTKGIVRAAFRSFSERNEPPKSVATWRLEGMARQGQGEVDLSSPWSRSLIKVATELITSVGKGSEPPVTRSRHTVSRPASPQANSPSVGGERKRTLSTSGVHERQANFLRVFSECAGRWPMTVCVSSGVARTGVRPPGLPELARE
jgi:hypothetical protein